jgi:hypothetical protein
MTGTEEKKRGQRLFGVLLGTLSQTSSKPAHKKRDEIEKRQQERLRRDTEDREEEKKRKKEELDRVRREEQKVWDREATKLKDRNRRAMAGFLVTKTEPKLYYRPWELRPAEEEQIQKQIREVDDQLRDGSSKQNGGQHTSPRPTDREGSAQDGMGIALQKQSEGNGDLSSGNEDGKETLKSENTKTDMQSGHVEKFSEKAPDEKDFTTAGDQKNKDDDRGGEVEGDEDNVIEGDEDNVIY